LAVRKEVWHGGGFSFAASKSRKKKSPTKDQKRFGYFCATKVTKKICRNFEHLSIFSEDLIKDFWNKTLQG